MTADGSVIAVGQTAGVWDGANAGLDDFAALRLDASGEEVWRYQVHDPTRELCDRASGRLSSRCAARYRYVYPLTFFGGRVSVCSLVTNLVVLVQAKVRLCRHHMIPSMSPFYNSFVYPSTREEFPAAVGDQTVGTPFHRIARAQAPAECNRHRACCWMLRPYGAHQ